jgi:hypothetical protein
MNKTMLVAIGLVGLLGVTSCSSDDNKLSISKSDQSQTTVGGDSSGSNTDTENTDTSDTDTSGTDTEASDSGDAGTIPGLPGVSVPGLGDCGAYLTAFSSALSGQKGGTEDLGNLFDNLSGHVPDDLKAAVETLAKDFGELQKLYQKYDYDFSKISTDPTFTALFTDQEFTDASSKFSEWINAGCPES